MNSRRQTINQLRNAIKETEKGAMRPEGHPASEMRVNSDERPNITRNDSTHSVSADRSAASATSSTTDMPEAAFKKIVELANVQERSTYQLRTRLKRDGFSESSIEAAIERAIECGIVNDFRYADILIRSRISQGHGSAGIENELRKQNIDVDEVPGWPFEYPLSYDEEYARALDLLERRPTKSKNAQNGAYRKLMQKGYPSSIASQVARQWAEMIDTSI